MVCGKEQRQHGGGENAEKRKRSHEEERLAMRTISRRQILRNGRLQLIDREENDRVPGVTS